jgi:hypothetical protein
MHNWASTWRDDLATLFFVHISFHSLLPLTRGTKRSRSSSTSCYPSLPNTEEEPSNTQKEQSPATSHPGRHSAARPRAFLAVVLEPAPVRRRYPPTHSCAQSGASHPPAQSPANCLPQSPCSLAGWPQARCPSPPSNPSPSRAVHHRSQLNKNSMNSTAATWFTLPPRSPTTTATRFTLPPRSPTAAAT